MNSRHSILQQLAGVDGDVALRAREWLSDEQTYLITDQTPSITVDDILHIWRVRQKISVQRGNHIFGAEPLLAALSAMAPQKKLDQFSLNGTDWVGNLYFERNSKRFVGAVMVPPKAKRQQAIPVAPSTQLTAVGSR